MERLTTRCAGHAVMSWEHEEQHTTQEWIDMLTDRLAAYEDTGLEPEDLQSNADIDFVRIVELLRADAEGRLVVLPCQWGTKLYSIFAALHNLLEDGEPPIREVQLVENNVCAIIRQFGKTVFLTREEAEAELRGVETEA